MDAAMNIHFAPILPDLWLYGLIGATALLLGLSFLFYRRSMVWRTLCAGAFLLIFLNPSLTEERREAVKDVAAIVLDTSPSQEFGQRDERSRRALEALQADLARADDVLETRIIEAPAATDSLPRDTRLFDALDQALADVPLSRRAGVIFITDGQIHDMPAGDERFADYGPVHALLSGERDEKDRLIVLREAPSYGIVGQEVTIRYEVEDINTGAEYASVIIRQGGKDPRMELVPVNTEQSLRVTIDHAGQNIIDIEAAPLDGEVTLANNRAAAIINGVRDRLRVLLVSGLPHSGGRTWRNILTSDPGVDLVHFTILREPDKLDATPQSELSLIAFPFRELFEIKLYEFDLIIFDRYRLNRILPHFYFTNIARYVEEGGALLEASGPSFASPNSIYTTDLASVLPGQPGGRVINNAFRPAITDLGGRHPVTEGLSWPGGEWGSWLRQVTIRPLTGDVLMTGAENEPLLLLDRVGEGRVAQLASDQIWLWARGYEGGGPQAELLRRLAHWLMKEPELEENALQLQVDNGTLLIRRRALEDSPVDVTVKTPAGERRQVTLEPDGSGALSARIDAAALGVYMVDDGQQERFAIVGQLNPPELRSVITTGDILSPLVNASRGGIYWLAETAPAPSVRLLPPGRDYGGRNWLGLRHNNSYHVTGVKDTPFLPPWLYALSLLSLVTATWWFEGRAAKKKK